MRETNIATGIEYADIALSILMGMIENPPIVAHKDASVCMLASAYKGHDARTAEVQRAKGVFTCLRADIDSGNVSLDDLINAVEAFTPENSQLGIYSTASASEVDARWRVLVPMADALPFAEWHRLQRAFNLHLKDWSIEPDLSTERANQYQRGPFKLSEDSFYEFSLRDAGPLFQPSDPACIKALAKVDEIDAQIDKAAQEAAERAAARREAKPKGSTLIDAYNGANPLPVAFDRYGFETQNGIDWRHPEQTSKSFSWRDMGDAWVCVSETPRRLGIGTESASGFRYGDAFDLAVHFEFAGDRSNAVKQLAQVVKVVSEEGEILTFNEKTRREYMEGQKLPQAAPLGSEFIFDAKPHPLADFVDPEAEIFTQDEFVIDGVIAAGTVMVAGAPGAGKTTQLVPLICRAAHLCRPSDPLKPLLRRKVVYVAEDISQVRRIIQSMRKAGELDGVSKEEVAEWFKLVDAKRLKPEEIIKAARAYSDLTALNKSPATGVEFTAQAVIVLDTRNAVIELDNENDNAEVSKAISTIRQGLPLNPLVIVGHTAKALKKAEAGDLSSRGAGAWEGDVQQVLYLTHDSERRVLTVAAGKHRFVTNVDVVSFKTFATSAQGVDQLGNPSAIGLVHGIPTIERFGDSGRIDWDRRQEGREQDRKAWALLRVMARQEDAGNYCYSGRDTTRGPNVVLKADPDFIALDLQKPDVDALIAQCARADWIEIKTITKNYKGRERWSVTPAGRLISHSDLIFSADSANSADISRITKEGGNLAVSANSSNSANTFRENHIGGSTF